MGKVVYMSSIENREITGLPKPVIYCSPNRAMIEGAASLNYALAAKLSDLKPKRRTIRLAMCFEEILRTQPDNVVIKDFDVMFNPEYKVDVLKIMVDVCKRKPFSVIWPGKYEDGKLLYAEDGYLDFKAFSVDEYDLTCCIQGGTRNEIF